MTGPRTQSTADSQRRHPADVLKPCLMGYGVLGGSSSGVEQGFSRTLNKTTPQQSVAGPKLEEEMWGGLGSTASVVARNC